MTFQRARSEEQREIRRRAILDTAAAMLDEMPVAEVSLNELSRRAGLAKSALLRYFDSREAVLLELLDYFLQTWLTELPDELAAGIDASLPAEQRAGRLAEVLSRSLAARPVLCDLFGAQGGVLEHNVTLEVALRHKRSSLDALATMTGLVHRHVPELGDGAQTFCLHALILAGALSAYCPPPAAVLAVYEADPSLAALGVDLGEALRLGLDAALLGTLPRTT
ncbi:TetR/AcrR family transcriptional regulator [Streptomyces sp. NPDC102462]|uniref:TetR/AcrR family transcriptional regulator n=1 Tax=Streptomyces sp. NPDC102462 TaxID=3366178 RepID=UPI003802CD5D